MNQISNAIYEIHHMDTIASRDQWVNQIHPLVKFVLTVTYIAMVVSFSKYDLIGLVGMMVYPIAGFILAELSFKDSLKRLRIVIPLVCLIGIVNPFFDRVPIQIGDITVNGGVISMFTLIFKGIFTVLAAYLLIATTTIEKICYALRLLHLPEIMITQFLLTYRYVTVLLEEVNRITQAYSLRAPNQKGIHYKVWGTLTGQVLLRSMDRANAVYESMLLRGYDGSFSYMGKDIGITVPDVIYMIFWLAVFIIFRRYPVFLIVGSLF
ncbi:MAG: cobalt ECF transporter T component CbiQ [Lachnospiraceae bacterium]|nr:cobalt ECF transporter T component CbiQ [Lachnospiraceae bacterium]